jgi:hypothetical protein
MVRYEINTGAPIRIAYGHDDIRGFFLSVSDDRIKEQEDATEEVNRVTQKVGVAEGVVGDGEGIYFELHTGIMGIGFKVTFFEYF